MKELKDDNWASKTVRAIILQARPVITKLDYDKGMNLQKNKPKKVKIIIERCGDSFTSYAENVNGVYGHGDTVEEAKQSALAGIELLKKYNKSENIPSILKGVYEVVFKIDGEI